MTGGGGFTTAVVIGASGGIGGALVDALVAGGTASVHALSRSGESSNAPRVLRGRIDIRDEASVAAAAAKVAESGKVDLILVATGLLHGENTRPEKTFHALSAEALTEYFAVNTIGPALVARHFLPLLPRNGRATFACLSARVGSIGDNRLGGWYGYRASKAALNMLVKTLAIELARTAPETICVALHPGTVETRLSEPFRKTRLAPVAPPAAARDLLRVLQGLTAEQSGGCFAWDGSAIVP